MSIDEPSPDGRSDRPSETADARLTAERAENRLLRARVAALERELAASRAERRQLIERYEALLSERRARTDGSRTERAGLPSRAVATLARVRARLSRRI